MFHFDQKKLRYCTSSYKVIEPVSRYVVMDANAAGVCKVENLWIVVQSYRRIIGRSVLKVQRLKTRQDLPFQHTRVTILSGVFLKRRKTISQ